MKQFSSTIQFAQAFSFFLISCLLLACGKKNVETLPERYQQKGEFIKSLPYLNPDSCVLLIRRDVPPRWQGAAYENLFLDGPEDSPLELGFRHLHFYEKNFPADTASEFAQLWRGRLYTHLGKLDSAQICLQASYESSIRNKHFSRAMDAQDFIANLHKKKGEIGKAIRAYLTVFDAVKDLPPAQNEKKYIAIANIAAAYFASSNAREALQWMHRAQPLVEDVQHPIFPESKVDFFQRISTIYGGLGMPDSALIFAQQALEFYETNKTISDHSDILEDLGKAYHKKGDCQTAVNYLREAQRNFRSQNPAQLGSLATNLADAYFCLGRRDSAEILYKVALRLPTGITTKNHIRVQLSQIFAKNENFKAAFENLDTVHKVQAKLYNPQKAQEIGAIRADLELQLEKQKTAEIQQQIKISRQQNLITALFFMLAVGFLASLFLRQRGRQQILEQEKQLLEKDKTLLEQEKELAQAYAQLQTQALERSQNQLQQTQEELDRTAQLLELKNQLIEDLQLQNQHRAFDEDDSTPRAALHSAELHRMKILTDEDWLKFQQRFEQSFPNFLKKLKSEFPAMTAAETRLFLLYKLQFSNHEIADTLGISVESVWRSRHRLGKKIGLSETGNLEEVVTQFN